MDILDYAAFVDRCDITDKIQQICAVLTHNATAIQRLNQRMQHLIALNETISANLQKQRTQEQEPCKLLEQSAPEERIMESIFAKREYKFHLILKKSVKMPFYKDRNFNLFIGLFDQNHCPCSNRNAIQLKIDVYTSGPKPQRIEINKQGHPILKGNCQVALASGSAAFSKLSIRQVSSKFERGLVTIIVYALPPEQEASLDNDIDWRLVRPLLLKDVMIRAKKL